LDAFVRPDENLERAETDPQSIRTPRSPCRAASGRSPRAKPWSWWTTRVFKPSTQNRNGPVQGVFFYRKLPRPKAVNSVSSGSGRARVRTNARPWRPSSTPHRHIPKRYFLKFRMMKSCFASQRPAPKNGPTHLHFFHALPRNRGHQSGLWEMPDSPRPDKGREPCGTKTIQGDPPRAMHGRALRRDPKFRNGPAGQGEPATVCPIRGSRKLAAATVAILFRHRVIRALASTARCVASNRAYPRASRSSLYSVYFRPCAAQRRPSAARGAAVGVRHAEHGLKDRKCTCPESVVFPYGPER
jgi:hypothetical protein